MAFHIFMNDVTIGGKVIKCQRSDQHRLARVTMDIPAGDDDNEREKGKTITVQVDVVGEKYPLTSVIKEGDFFACKAQIITQKVQPDNKDKKYQILWLQALNSRPLTIIPDGGKYAPAAFNEVIFQGKAFRISDLREYGEGRKMCFVTVSYMPKLDRNATEEQKKEAMVYADAAFFGGTAERYIKEYLKEGDNIALIGNLTMFEEKWTRNGKKVVSLRINARDAKFLTPAGSGDGRKKSDAPDYSAYDEDLPF